MIDKIGDWIYVEALFSKTKQENQVDWENLGISPPEDDEYEHIPFRFNIKFLIAYNDNPSTESTTIRLVDGYSYGINVPFKVFDEFIAEKCKRKWYE